MTRYIYILSFLLVFCSCQSQTKQGNSNKIIGGPCQGCEAIYEYGNKTLTSIDTLPAFKDTEPKLKISGVVYKKDGKTPAKDVILYIYHTNRNGIYEKKGGEKGWAKRHGYIRGWVKTNPNGKYTFYTFRPTSYPNREEPEHIHITVKEPDKNEYYIDAYVFDDDPLLSSQRRKSLKFRGGSGIVLPTFKNDMLSVERNIILGLNIPDYR